MRMCRNRHCERRFPSDVDFCPYCGEAQRTPPSRGGASPNARVIQDGAPTQDRKTADASTGRDDASLSTVLAPVLGAVDVSPAPAPADMVPMPGSRLAVLATRPVTWMLVVVIALLLLASLRDRLSKVLPSAEYQTVSCAGTIASELSVLVDLPARLEPSTKAELLARLSQQLDAGHVGVQRMNLFSTASEHGDAGTPIFSACTSRAALASLFRLHGVDPRLKSDFVDNVEAAMKARGTASPSSGITQVVADLSVSQYLRASQNTLVVFSDLVEKSNGISLLVCRDPQDAIRSYRAARAGGVERPAFKNVSVDLNVIPDAGIEPSTGQCRKTFWNWYFGDVEGENAHVTMNYLPGRQLKNTKP
jgi:hypothetical protein